jgi:hypothetical protein
MQCLHCGYDLRGSTEQRCPECGKSSSLESRRQFFAAKRRSARMRGNVLRAGSIPAFLCVLITAGDGISPLFLLLIGAAQNLLTGRGTTVQLLNVVGVGVAIAATVISVLLRGVPRFISTVTGIALFLAVCAESLAISELVFANIISSIPFLVITALILRGSFREMVLI